MSEKGKILIRKSKKGKWIFEVDIHKKNPMKIPDFYDLKNDSLNEKECEVIREKNGQIKKITVDGEELPKKQFSPKTFHREFDKEHHKDIHNRGGNIQKATDIPDSLDIEKTRLPDDTRNALKGIKDIDNFALKLNKAARFEGEKFKFFETTRRGVKYQIKANISEEMIKDISKRYYDSIKKLNLKLSKELILKPEWRMIIGLGNESVYETSMTLHHIYGIPYIPGSAIKGVIGHYFIQNEFEETECEWKQINVFENVLENFDVKKDEELDFEDFKRKFSTKDRKASENLYNYFCESSNIKNESKILIELYQTLFGSQKKKGSIIFFDAFPIKPPNIEPDVINVHYPDYYGESKPPADYQNPKPIFFLTVKETPFQFIIGIKSRDNTTINGGKFKGQNIMKVAEKYLKGALSEHGIGAKTAVGYGYMKSRNAEN